jgi:hypothetical protein
MDKDLINKGTYKDKSMNKEEINEFYYDYE